MTQQPVLFSDNRDLDIKSPVFTSRPGWGGRLKAFLTGTSGGKTVWLLLIAVGMIAAFTYIRSHPVQTGNPADISEKPAAILIAVQKGEGPTHLARYAITRYVAENGIFLTSAQRAYAEEILRHTAVLKANISNTVSIPFGEIEAVIEKTEHMTETQTKVWHEYSLKIKEFRQE